MSTESKKPPNILLILTDQQNHLAFPASPKFKNRLPGMQSLADRGVHFNQAYCTYPVCGPSRASILTGRMPSEAGVFRNGENVKYGIQNIGEWLREHSSYRTVLSGKWHLRQPNTALVPGFEVIASGINCMGILADAAITASCEAFLRANAESSDRPFFLAVMYTQPHDICAWIKMHREGDSVKEIPPEVISSFPPLPENFNVEFQEPESLRQLRSSQDPAQENWNEDQWRYYLWAYERQVEMVDAEIGRLVDTLEELDMMEDTAIIFASDHGEGCGSHSMVTKDFLYDEASRVPLVLSYPEKLGQGIADSRLVSLLDIFPTICDLANVPVPIDLNGRSLIAKDEKANEQARDFVACEYLSSRGIMIRSPQFKYIAHWKEPIELLFDMESDPQETKNLAGDPTYSGALVRHRLFLRSWVGNLKAAPNLPHRAEILNLENWF